MAPRDLSIGLTFDLRTDQAGAGLSEEQLAELDSPATIAALEDTLRDLGHRPDRIGNVHALAARLAAGDRWDLVFNIAEGLFGIGREAQVPALLDAYRIPYTFSDPLVNALTLHKGMTKRVLRDLGLPTAAFAVITAPSDIDALELRYPLFAKPVAEGTSKGIHAESKATDGTELRRCCEVLLARYQQPVLVEEFLPGREFTVGIVGSGTRARAVGALEIVMNDGADQGIYTFRNKEECESLVTYTLATDALAEESCRLAVQAWRGLGCRDAGRVDLRADPEGRLAVLEINPLAGMHPSHSDLPILWGLVGGVYRDLVAAIVASASERIATEPLASCTS